MATKGMDVCDWWLGAWTLVLFFTTLADRFFTLPFVWFKWIIVAWLCAMVTGLALIVMFRRHWK